MRVCQVFGLGLVVIVLAACAPAPAGGLQVQNAVIQIPGQAEVGGTAAGYFTIRNGGAADRLIGVTADIAAAVELHATELQDNVMSMAPVEGVDLPAGGQAELKRGGQHVMFIGLTRVLTVGEKIPLTLTFEHAGALTVEAEVRAP